MDLSTFYSQFRDEANENIRILTEGLLALESFAPKAAGWREQIDTIFRAMHTIKGSARLLGFEQVGQLAHTCEHILGAVRDGRRVLDRALADDLLRGADALLELTNAGVEGRRSSIDVEALTLTLGRGNRNENTGIAEAPNEDAATSPGLASTTDASPADVSPVSSVALQMSQMKPARPAVRQTIRVRVDRLDRLLNLAGELAVGRQTQSAQLQMLDEIFTLVEQQERALVGLDRQLKQLRFSPLQREALERHINAALNAGELAGK